MSDKQFLKTYFNVLANFLKKEEYLENLIKTKKSC